MLFEKNNANIIGPNFKFQCERVNNLFVFENDFSSEDKCYKTVESDLWHRRLGHLNKIGLTLLKLPTNQEKCVRCIEGKSSRKPFYPVVKNSKQVGNLIHSDVAGPVNPPTLEGYKYYQVIVDEFSHFTVVKLLRTKGEAEENVIDFIRLIKTQHGLKTKRIRCDNGGEYSSNHFKQFCRSRGIQLEYTMPYSPQQNGIAERMNRTLIDKVRTKFAETNLPKELWGEAIRCSAYELNRSPTKANKGNPPAKMWYGYNDLSKLRVFGNRAWMVKLLKQNKLDTRTESTIMVGYNGGGYRL